MDLQNKFIGNILQILFFLCCILMWSQSMVLLVGVGFQTGSSEFQSSSHQKNYTLGQNTLNVCFSLYPEVQMKIAVIGVVKL